MIHELNSVEKQNLEKKNCKIIQCSIKKSIQLCNKH